MAHILPEVFGTAFYIRQAENQGVVRQVVKQAVQLFKEQRQVILDAGWYQPLAEILIDRAAAVVDLEMLAEAGAKLGQCRFVEGKLLGRQQMDMLDLVDRALGFGIKGPQGFNFIVKQVDAQRQAAAHGVQIQQRAAHGVVTVLIDGIDTAVTS